MAHPFLTNALTLIKLHSRTFTQNIEYDWSFVAEWEHISVFLNQIEFILHIQTAAITLISRCLRLCSDLLALLGHYYPWRNRVIEKMYLCIPLLFSDSRVCDSDLNSLREEGNTVLTDGMQRPQSSSSSAVCLPSFSHRLGLVPVFCLTLYFIFFSDSLSVPFVSFYFLSLFYLTHSPHWVVSPHT